LPPLAAHLFRLLALHPGTSISGPAASTLAAASTADARRLLDDLANAHLLEETGPDRYQFHDLVRLYAREAAAAEETTEDRDAAMRRLLRWYLHTADAAGAVLNPGRPRVPLLPPDNSICPLAFADHDDALRWCEDEHTNMVSAAHYAAVIGDHATAWQLPMALFDFFSLRKLWSDWIATNHLGLDSARRLSDEFGEGAILTSLGIAYYDLRRFGDAIDCFRRALPIWRAIGFPQAEAVTLDPLGAAYRDTGRFGEALDCLQRALLIWRDVGDTWGEGITLHNIGDTYRDLGHFDQAIHFLHQSHSVRQQIGDQWGVAWTLHDLGSAYADLHRYDDANERYQQALTIRRQIGDRHGEARTLRRLGHIYRTTGRPEMASDQWRQAQTIFEDLGDHPRTAQIRAYLNEL
jgi:tetratricopeptide (TPR) repeat protein